MTFNPTGSISANTLNSVVSKLQMPSETPLDPQAIANEVAVSRAAPQEPARVELPQFDEAPPVVEEPPVQEEPAVIPDVEDPDDAELPVTPAAENFKKLRTIAKEAKKAKRELEAQVAEREQELQKYKTGEVVPDVITAKDQRIAELEQYEKIVNIKLSPEYQREYVEPSLRLAEQLDRHAQSYGLEPAYLRQAVEIENQKELNQFLTRHFDDLGALEAKKIITELQDIGSRALQAEQEPAQVMEQLKVKYQQQQIEKEKQISANFEMTAKSAWQKALDKTIKENVYKELIPDPNDVKHTEQVVKPLQTKASQQFGALVTQLRKNGLTQLPEELAVGLARMTQLAVASAIAFDAKNKAEQQFNKVVSTSRVVSPYIRPSMAGNTGQNVRAANNAPRTLADISKEAASRIRS